MRTKHINSSANTVNNMRLKRRKN